MLLHHVPHPSERQERSSRHPVRSPKPNLQLSTWTHTFLISSMLTKNAEHTLSVHVGIKEFNCWKKIPVTRSVQWVLVQELSKTGFCVPIAQKAKPQPAYFSCSFNPLVGILKTYCNTSAIQFSLQGTGSIIWLAVHYIVYNKHSISWEKW